MNQAVMADKKRDEDTGQYQTKFSDKDFIEAVESIESATTQKICDEVGCAYRTGHGRLTHLEEEGTIKGQKIGQTLIWTVKDEE